MPSEQDRICGGGGGIDAVSIPGGNTAGVLGVISSGTVYLAGGDNITLSQNGQSITISGGAGGSGGGVALSLAGNTDGALALISSGTAILAGGNNITLSQNGQSVTISAANQSNQTLGLYASSNTYLTSSGTVDARSLTFRGDKSITVGVSAGEVLFSVGAYLTTAMASNRGSDFVQATAAFNGTNASGTIASGAISVSVAAPIPIATAVNPVASANSTGTVTRYAPEDHRHAGVAAIGISTAGNTAGTTGSEVGTYWFQGGNSITVSQITSNNGSHTLVISAGNYLTTAMASDRGSDFVQATAGFNGTNVSGTIASNSVSVSVAAPIPIATAVNPVASANSTGTVTRYAPEDHRHAGVAAIGISTAGNSAGTTGTEVGTYWLQGGNSITLSQITSNNGSHTLIVSAGNYLTTAALSGDTTKYVQAWELTGNTAGTTSSLQGTKLYFAGGNSITVSGNSNTITFSVGNYITTADLSQNSSKYVQNWKLTGNTAGTTSSAQGTDLWFSGGNSVTVSGNSNTIVISAAAQTTQSAIKAFGASNTGNTAGNTGVSTGIDWVLAGTNLVTISESTVVGGPNTLWISAANSASTFQGGISTGGQTAGSTGVVDQRLVFVGTNGITLSGSTDAALHSGTITILGPSPHLSYYSFLPMGVLQGNTLTTSVAQSTSSMMPFNLGWNYSFDRMRLIASGSVAASSTQATTGNTSLSMTAVTSHNLVVYSRGAGASSLSLQYVTSTQVVDQCSMRISYNANSTQYSVSLRYSLGSDSFTKDYSISSGTVNWHTSHLTDLTGLKVLDVPMGFSLSPGNYWLGYGRSTTTQTQAASVSVATRLAVSHNSILGLSQNTLGAIGMLGSASVSSVGWYPAFGSYTTGGAAGTTSSVEMSAVSTNTSHAHLHLQFMRIV